MTSNWKYIFILVSIHKSCIVYFEKKYAVPIGHGNSFFGHGKVMENHCWKRVVTLDVCVVVAVLKAKYQWIRWRGRLQLPPQKLHRLRYRSRELMHRSLKCSHSVMSLCLWSPSSQVCASPSSPPHSTRSSSLITLAHPPTSSSLWTTNRSFRYASPYLWNQFPVFLPKPHTSFSVSDSPFPDPVTSSLIRHSSCL